MPIAANRYEDAKPVVTRQADDAALVRRLANGEPEALGAAYDRYAPSLYRVLLALLGAPADAEDALQEVFVKVATGHLGHVRDLRAYLLVAARHQAIGMLRRRKREGLLDDMDLPPHEASPISNSADSAFDWTLLLARLPLEQREVIALKVWEQLTFAEIAPIVKASPNTVMSRYRYGIERLRAWCREEDGHDL